MLETIFNVVFSKPVLDGFFLSSVGTRIAATAQAFLTGHDVVLEFLNSVGIDPRL